MGQTSSRAFSFGWVLVTYFLVAGCIIIVSSALGAAKIHETWTGYVAFGAGSALGGFFGGRASPHHSIIESTLAGLLVVGSIVLLILATPLAALFSMGDSQGAITDALVLGVIAMGGGFVGGWLGEKSSESSGVSKNPGRWLGISILVNLGTLWTAAIILAVLMLRADTGADLGLDDATNMIVATCAVAAFSAGLFTQSVAPARMLLASAGGTLLTYVGLGLLQGVQQDKVPEMVKYGAIVGVAGAIVALLGALLGWLIVRNRVLAEA